MRLASIKKSARIQTPVKLNKALARNVCGLSAGKDYTWEQPAGINSVEVIRQTSFSSAYSGMALIFFHSGSLPNSAQ